MKLFVPVERKKELLGTTCVEIAGYSLCSKEACAFSRVFLTHLGYRVTALKKEYTMYSVRCPFQRTNVSVLLKGPSSNQESHILP